MVGDGRRKTITDYQDDLQGSESEDDDFVAKEDSDVDEEFNSDYSSEEEGGEKKEGDKRERTSEAGSEPESDGDAEPVEKVAKSSKADKGEPKKKKAKKEGPKRPLTSFLYYSMAKRVAIKDANPSFSLGEISKELGVMWKSAGSEDKAEFEELARIDKERYAGELKIFQDTGVLPGNNKAKKEVKEVKEVKKEAKITKDKDERMLSTEFVESEEDDF